MQRLGRLEIFARQLQYDKNIGYVEARVSKALLFATASMSSPAHSLDQLMAQCQFMPNDDATALFAKRRFSLNPILDKPVSGKIKTISLMQV